MSATIDTRVVEPGSDEYVEAAWKLKERIRRENDVLKQRRGFFTDAYQRSNVRLLLADDELVGFSATRRDGYILFLAVSPEYRGQGLGQRLVGDVAEEHGSVSCHARTTNDEAIEFYEHIGFEIRRRIDNYYEDGGDAFYLKLGEGSGITRRLSDFMRR